ncbi:MAG: hypothetical protein KF770_05075 [Anaerolineae bacterium]|nr:hypothetical protein [Anaerolineae bacterium]
MDGANDELNVKIPPVPIVVSECHQGEADGANTVMMLAASGLTGNGNEPGKQRNGVGFTNTKPNATLTRPCQQCGREMVVRRPSKRFCGAACRRVAWLVCNPDKAAVLAANDKARLRVHLEGRGVVWIEQAA